MFRLLHVDRWTLIRGLSFVLTLLLLILNAGWNFFFFRRRDLKQSLLINIPYGAVALGLLVTLFRVDPLAGRLFTAYIVYLSYAIWFGYRVWQLNAGGPAA
jgi:tryptophan-rich sensory protein